MKTLRLFILAAIALSVTGCRGLNRLIQGEDPEPTPVKVISSRPDLGSAPDFNLPQPANTTKTVYYDFMPDNFQVAVAANADAAVDVFVQDFSGFWFELNTTSTSGYIYVFDAAGGSVRYTSNNQQLNLSLMKVYCIYHYVPEVN